MNEASHPRRDRVSVQTGALVQQGQSVYRIAQVLDFESVVAVEVESGKSALLRVGELRPVAEDRATPSAVTTDLEEIADEDWRIAGGRFAAIKPLLDKAVVGRTEVEARAREVGVNAATLYRWLGRYRAYGVVSALVPQKRGWKEGKGRIPPHAERVIEEVIRDFYLKPQRPTAQKAVLEVLRRCNERGIEPPSPSTVRARLAQVSERDTLRGRGFREKAKNKFLPAAGTFPNADFPLSVVQIDHTRVDLIVVDDQHRKPIERPYLTLALDVYSRVVVGYYLSLDPPSETSVAMCIAQAILPKDEWLVLHGVDTKWPVWGIPKTIHVDNGADFRSDNFRQSCLNYGINLEFRPVKQPRYGGTIERGLGTLLREVHDLPGTTFSSIRDREGYDSEKHAALTLSELEKWLVTWICKVYHQRFHSSIGMSPLKKWEVGVFGNAEVQGVGVPPLPADRLTVLLDFLPSFRRTVQPNGVTIEHWTYYAEALRPWIGAVDADTKKKREFVFRRDPRDISSVWFFDPVLKQYFRVPFADQRVPSMSAWEHQQTRERLKREGNATPSEPQVLRALTELRDQVEASQERTKKARRQAQRRREHEKGVSPAAPLPVRNQPAVPVIKEPAGLLEEDIDFVGELA